MNEFFHKTSWLSHLSVITILFGWGFASHAMGPALVPAPAETLEALWKLMQTPEFYQHLSITLVRASLALALAVILALVTGIAAGLSRGAMAFMTPLMASLQSTPPILWITLLMVWAGTGGTVPLAVVTVTLFPPIFSVVAQSTAHLPKAYFDTCRVHGIPFHAVLMRVILPGIFPGFLGAFSFALGTCWKTAAVAEFLGSSSGIGSQIYWSYRMLEMETLFAWGLTLVSLGLALEFGLIRPLKERAKQSHGG